MPDPPLRVVVVVVAVVKRLTGCRMVDGRGLVKSDSVCATDPARVVSAA